MAIALREGDEAAVGFVATPPVYELDVRPMLEAGGEPYQVIMHCVAQLAAGDELRIHALFEPRPLLRQFERMGLEIKARALAAEHWVVAVRRRLD